MASSTAAEALATNDAIGEALYVQAVLKEMQGDGGVNIPIKVYTDSKNLHKAANTSALVEDSKLRLDLAILKESILSKDIEEFIHVEGRKMLADCLTKKGASAKLLMRIMKTGKMEDISGKNK